MVLLRRLLSGIDGLIWRTRVENELDDELQEFLETSIEEKIGRGLSREEATRAARMELGSMEAIKDRVRDVRWESVLDSLWQDARYSWRRLASRPTYLLLTVFTLALGAGGTAAVFSVIRGLLLDPLPIAREAQVGVLWMPGYWTEEEFLDLRQGFAGFQSVAAYRPLDPTLDIPGSPLRVVRGIGSSAELFDVLGKSALIGHTFQGGDDRANKEPVVILSHRLWKELGGDAALIGRQLRIGGVPRTVLGIMPAGFWFPNPEVDIWMTMPLSPENRIGNYALVGRVDQKFAIDQMDGPLNGIAQKMRGRFQYLPQFDKTKSPGITPIREFLVGDMRPGLFATFAAMALILLIACVNVGALMLGQVSGRRTELALRTALGAGRSRLLQQLVIESLSIGALAGTAGALLAAGMFQLLVRSLPLGRFADTARLDWGLFAFALLVALGAAAGLALIPGAVLWSGNLRGTLATVRTGGMSTRGGRLEGMLVVAQIALAVLLSTGAALLVRSVALVRAIDAGVRTEYVAVLDTTLPTELASDARRRAILDVIPALRALPNVRAVAASMKLPLRGPGQDAPILVDGQPDVRASTYIRIVTRDYFTVLGIAIRRGRGFLSTDRQGTEPVVVINEAFANKFFPGEDPLDRTVRTSTGERPQRIVGVVQNVAEASLTDGPVAARYMLYEQSPLVWHQVAFVLSATGPEYVAPMLQAARSVLQRESHQIAVQRMTTMGTVFDEAVGARAQLANLLLLLAGVALVLGAVGVYGMISHVVSRRTHDYGIRIALGLPPQRLIFQVLSGALRLVGMGSIAGIAAALALTRLLSSLLYGVGAMDLPSMAASVLALFVVGTLAAFVPARRASLTNPALVLRQD
jgi:predicted permease